MRLVIPVACCLLISACGVPTYLRPDTANRSASASVTGSRARIVHAAVTILIHEGYQIAAVDDALGLVSTAPQPMRVSPAQADCGKVQGLAASADPLTYPQPRTRVAFSVVAEDNHVEVRTRIDDRIDFGRGETTVTCVSRGVLERELLNRIESAL